MGSEYICIHICQKISTGIYSCSYSPHSERGKEDGKRTTVCVQKIYIYMHFPLKLFFLQWEGGCLHAEES